jgi:hygromycin-B 4-O-kinase
VRGEPAVHHPARLKILEQVGRYGAMINSITMEGFGENFVAPPACGSWVDYLRNEFGLEGRLQALLQHGMLDDDRVERLRAVLEKAGEGVTHGQLNHGDLRLKNVLVDDSGEITAIIDWEDCLSALAPQWEWSIALHDLSIDAMEAFLGGYGATRERVEELSPVVKALNIVNYVPAIERLIRDGKAEPLGWIRTRMSGALDLYSV